MDKNVCYNFLNVIIRKRVENHFFLRYSVHFFKLTFFHFQNYFVLLCHASFNRFINEYTNRKCVIYLIFMLFNIFRIFYFHFSLSLNFLLISYRLKYEKSKIIYVYCKLFVYIGFSFCWENEWKNMFIL